MFGSETRATGVSLNRAPGAAGQRRQLAGSRRRPARESERRLSRPLQPLAAAPTSVQPLGVPATPSNRSGNRPTTEEQREPLVQRVGEYLLNQPVHVRAFGPE